MCSHAYEHIKRMYIFIFKCYFFHTQYFAPTFMCTDPTFTFPPGGQFLTNNATELYLIFNFDLCLYFLQIFWGEMNNVHLHKISKRNYPDQ